MAQVTREIEEIMNSILENVNIATENWERLQKRYSISGARRIRKAYDEVSRKKVELRKAMLEEERK